MKKKLIAPIGGFLAGIINGLLGAAGGMVLLPLLSKAGLETKKAHANSVAIILPICILSSIIYINNGKATFQDASPYLIWGIIGAIIGAFLLTKIKDIWLHRIFGILVIWAAIRMLIR